MRQPHCPHRRPRDVDIRPRGAVARLLRLAVPSRLPASGALRRPLLMHRASRHRVPHDRRLPPSDPWTARCHYHRDPGALAPSASTMEDRSPRPLLRVLTARCLHGDAVRSQLDHSPHPSSRPTDATSSQIYFSLHPHRCSPAWGRRHLAPALPAPPLFDIIHMLCCHLSVLCHVEMIVRASSSVAA